jgi:hypothetical protein
MGASVRPLSLNQPFDISDNTWSLGSIPERLMLEDLWIGRENAATTA